MKFKVGDKVRYKSDLEKTFSEIKNHANEKGNLFKIKKIWESFQNMYELEGFDDIRVCEKNIELVKAEVWTKKDIEEKAKTQTFNIYPQKVIFNDKATILFYKCSFDYIPIERKIVAKCLEGDKYSKEDGLRICVLKAMKRELERELKQY